KFQVERPTYIHVPVWFSTYEYKGRSYDALLEGSSGAVLRADIPQTDFKMIGASARKTDCRVYCSFVPRCMRAWLEKVAVATKRFSEKYTVMCHENALLFMTTDDMP